MNTKHVTYWTEFGVEGFEPKPHVTHKYFGPKTDAEVNRIIDVLADYFEVNYVKSFPAAFLDRSTFGDADIPVAVVHPQYLIKFLPDLKRLLDFFAFDSYPYRPHVSETHRGLIVFTHYRLRSSQGIIYEHEFIKG